MKGLLLLFVIACCAPAATWYVGGDSPANYGTDAAHVKSKPCLAFAAASDGDTVRIDARYGWNGTATDNSGIYINDVCGITKNGLTIQGFNGRPHIKVTNKVIYASKAIWSLEAAPKFPSDPFATTTIENFEFSGAQQAGITNAACVRLSAGNLIIRNVYMHDSQMPLLTDYMEYNDLLVESWQSENTLFGLNNSHNAYVDKMRSVVVRYSYSNCANLGNLFKSRAWQTFYYANRLTEEYCKNSYWIGNRQSTGSYEIDAPLGGTVYAVGNLIQQGGQLPSPQEVVPPQPGLQGGNGSVIRPAGECTANQKNYKAGHHIKAVLAENVNATQSTLHLFSTRQLPSSGTAKLLTETYITHGLPGFPSVLDRITVLHPEDFTSVPGTFQVQIRKESAVMTVTSVSGNDFMLSTPYSGTSYYIGATVALTAPEEITWTGKDDSTNTLTGVTRGANGTTARLHSRDQYLEMTSFQTDIHVVNNTIVSDATWPGAKYGAVHVGMNSFVAGSECGVDPNGPIRLLNNVIYTPQSQQGTTTYGVFPYYLGTAVQTTGPQPVPAVDAPEAHNWLSSDFSSGPSTGQVAAWFYDPLLTQSVSDTRYAGGLYDYHLKPTATQMINSGSAALDNTGIPCGIGLSEMCSEVQPYEYVHPVNKKPRSNQNDNGAFGYSATYSVPLALSVAATSTVQSLQTGTVTVTLPAAQGVDTNVAFISSDENVSPKPENLVIPAGAISGTTTFSTWCQAETNTVRFSALTVLAGAQVKGISNTVTVVSAPFTITNISRDTSAGPHFTINNCGAAPQGGATVSVTSSDPAALWAPATVTVPEGMLTASLGTMTGSNFTASTKPANLTVTYGSSSLSTGTVNIARSAMGMWYPQNGLTEVNCGMAGLNTTKGPIKWAFSTSQPAPHGGTTLYLTSNYPAIVPDQLFSIPEDDNAVRYDFGTGVQSYAPVYTYCGSPTTTVSVTGTLNGVSKTWDLIVNGDGSSPVPQLAQWYAISGAQPVVPCGTSFDAYVSLSSAAGDSGATIPITSGNLSVITNTSAEILAGATIPARGKISIPTVCGQGSLNIVNLTASYGGVDRQFSVVVTDNLSVTNTGPQYPRASGAATVAGSGGVQ